LIEKAKRDEAFGPVFGNVNVIAAVGNGEHLANLLGCADYSPFQSVKPLWRRLVLLSLEDGGEQTASDFQQRPGFKLRRIGGFV
jgi:hypothetical protein